MYLLLSGFQTEAFVVIAIFFGTIVLLLIAIIWALIKRIERRK